MAVRWGFPILETLDLARLERFSLDAFDGERTVAFQDDRGRDVDVALQLGGASLGIGLAEELDGPPRVRGERVTQVDDPDGRRVSIGTEA